MTDPQKPTIFCLIKRALVERCPKCGRGHLFTAYLKPVVQCPVCAESFETIRADDGPAWLTILLVCHIIVPLMIAVQIEATWPDWVAIPVWLVLTVILSLLTLPRAKAFFIAIIWRNRVFN